MKLLLIGACGRLGRAVAREAEQRGHQVVGLDVIDWPADQGPRPAALELHHGSYQDIDALAALMPGCDAIVQTGGPHGGDVNTLDLAGFLDAHVTAVARLLDRAREHGIRRVVLSSTMEVVIGPTWDANGMAWVDEQTPARPATAYSLSRYTMEQLARGYARQTGMSIVCLRYMSFGYRADKDLGLNLLSHALPARDAARAVLAAAQRDSFQGEVIHLGPDTPLSPQDITAAADDPAAVLEKHYPGAAAVLAQLNIDIESRFFWPVTDIRLARLLLDWRPRYTFRDWLIEHGWSPPDTGAPSAPGEAARGDKAVPHTAHS